MSIIRRKENKLLKVIKKIIPLFIIILIVYILTNIFPPKTEIATETFSLDILKNKEENNIIKEQANVIVKYNTLFVQMDTVFSNIFDNYDSNIDEQSVTFNDTTFEIKRNSNIITVPDFYEVNTDTIDNSIDVEIEEVDGIKYIPVYLLSNINGIEVKVDEKIVYNKNNYINSIEALDSEKTDHTVTINEVAVKSDEELSDTEYVGEQLGALWREEAYKRIEKYRKSDVDIVVKNQNKKTIENANISLNMNNNDFKFGTSIRVVNATGKNNFEGTNRSLFNTVCSENGIKWPQLSKNGNTIAEDVSNFAKDNGMYLRGHYLWCDYVVPDLLDLVGNENELQEGTMAYIYNEYKNKNITKEQANEQIETIKKEFEKRVINHVKDVTIQFPTVNEWNVINESIAQEYFKFYLYDKNFLTNPKFLTTDERNTPTSYIDNNEYYEFMAKCFDVARENNPNAKLVLNENKFNGGWENFRIDELIRVINNIKRYTDNIDYIGIQYHIKNAYNFTPQSYYNKINYLLNQTGVEKAVITEYDNYISGKQNTYTDEEIKEKADYLRDSLIAQYSNMNVSEFTFWVYNSGTGSFSNEERQEYQNLIQEWLNDEEEGIISEDGTYSTRLYKGEYTATIKVGDYEKEVPITVSDETGNVEIVLEGDIYGYGDKLNELINQYTNFENMYGTQIAGIEGLTEKLNTIKQTMQNTTYETDVEEIINQFEETYKLGNIFVDNISDTNELINVLKGIEAIGQKYRSLVEINKETIDIDVGDIETQISSMIESLNANNDLDIQGLMELKDKALSYYASLGNEGNYTKKYNLISIQNIKNYIDMILNKKIDVYLQSNPIGEITYAKADGQPYVSDRLINQSVIATLPTTEDMQITSEGGNTHTFENNDLFTFTYIRRGRSFEAVAIVNNIDKDAPSITGAEDGQRYINAVMKLEIQDPNLDKIELYKNEGKIGDYTRSEDIPQISEKGTYKVVASDKAGNIITIQFAIVDKKTEYINRVNELIEQYNNFENTYSSQISRINNLSSSINNIKQELQKTTNNTRFNKVIEQLENTYKLGNSFIESNSDNLIEILKGIETIGQKYKGLIELSEEKTNVNIGDIEKQLSTVNDNLNKNTDLNIQGLVELKDTAVGYFNSINDSSDYMKKYNLVSTQYIKIYVEKILSNMVDKYVRLNPIGDITYSTTADKITNENVIATLPIRDNMRVLSVGENTHTFTRNGEFKFRYNRRGNEYEATARVANIDKIPPVIKGIADSRTYTNAISPKVQDEHLDENNIKLYFNDNLKTDYKNGNTISDIGKYKMIAIDQVENKTEVNFEIKEKVKPNDTNKDIKTNVYEVQGDIIKKITASTTYKDFRKNIQTGLEYEIRRNGDVLAEEDNIATGDVLIVNNTNKQYTLIVTGDITKDGKVGISDLVRTRKFLLRIINLDNIEKLAADVNLDGKNVDISDLVRIRKMILEK